MGSSSTIILSMRKLCPESLIVLCMRFSVWKQGSGFERNPLQFELYGRDSTNDKLRGVHGTPTEGELECVWAGAGGEVGKICL